MIRCPTCGNDLTYPPIPALYFCLERMNGDTIKIRTQCKPWIGRDAPAEDLIALTDNLAKLAPELDVSRPQGRGMTPFVRLKDRSRAKLDSPV